jgi:hypothetical protein
MDKSGYDFRIQRAEIDKEDKILQTMKPLCLLVLIYFPGNLRNVTEITYLSYFSLRGVVALVHCVRVCAQLR